MKTLLNAKRSVLQQFYKAKLSRYLPFLYFSSIKYTGLDNSLVIMSHLCIFHPFFFFFFC